MTAPLISQHTGFLSAGAGACAGAHRGALGLARAHGALAQPRHLPFPYEGSTPEAEPEEGGASGGEEKDAVNDCSQPTTGKNLRVPERSTRRGPAHPPRLCRASARNLPSSAFQPGRQPLGKHARACKRRSNSVRAGEKGPAPSVPSTNQRRAASWGAGRGGGSLARLVAAPLPVAEVLLRPGMEQGRARCRCGPPLCVRSCPFAR